MHHLTIAQLAVGHIQEVGTADKSTEFPPRLFVDLAIRGIAVVNLAMDGDRPIRRQCAVIEKLLEIGAVIFIVTPGDARGLLGLFDGQSGLVH